VKEGNLTAISKDTRRRAASLRREQTFQEKALWVQLRELKAYGIHVRRQAPVGPYVADFAILSCRVLIEIDGEVHGAAIQCSRDEARDRWLQKEGFEVWRYAASDVEHNLEGVVEDVLRRLGLQGSAG
jgi:very-short-patch-repair endonuclease